MGFLQQRADGAIARYRESIADYRTNDNDQGRANTLKDQILTYRRRCRILEWATLTGLLAAILLIASMILLAFDIIMPKVALINDAGSAAAILGFVLIIVAACLVIVEGRIVNEQLEIELNDIAEVKQG